MAKNTNLHAAKVAKNDEFYTMLTDIEKEMLSQGSIQTDLWGINLYPEMDGDDFIEFDSLINIRPFQGNRSRDVLNPIIRKQIVDIVNSLIQ